MSLEEKAKAAAKNIEGKVQDAAGKAKQVEANARNAKEDLKDSAKRTVDNV
jgi:uncharacterized protein YjbJ (UPF0337 family)